MATELDPAIQDFYDAIPAGVSVSLTGSSARAPVDSTPVTPGPDGSLPYRAFKARHPTYDSAHWRRVRALYEGGRKLLEPKMLVQLLARNNREPPEVFAFRLAQAFYVNHCNEIIDFIIQTLATDPIRILKDGKEPPEDDPVEAWARDVSSTLAQGQTPLPALALEIVTEAMVVDNAWVILDKPPIDDGAAEPVSLLEAEQLGLTRTCTRVVPAEEVVHWEYDPKTKQLRWALLCTVDVRHDEFWSSPTVVETFTRYDDRTFTQWVIEYPVGRQPLDDFMVRPARVAVPHGFERNPLRRFALPAGLRAMSKLESIARNILNKWCALDIAERRSLLPTLYEFQGAEHGSKAAPVSIAQRDAGRAVNTPRSPHHVQVRGKDDDARFIGPSSEPFKHALDSINALKDEMHRVLYQMSLATDGGSGAAVGRSGASKKEDRNSSVVIATAVGRLMLAFICELIPDVLHVAVPGSTIKDARAYTADGYQKFESIGVSDLVADTQILASIDIPSETARREILMRMLRRYLDGLHEDKFREIEEQLRRNLTAEQVIHQIDPKTGMPVAAKPGDANSGEDDGDGADDEGDAEDELEDAPAPPAKKPAPRRAAKK